MATRSFVLAFDSALQFGLRTLVVALWLVGDGEAAAQICTNHTFLGDRPHEGNPGWESEAQGLAHDDDHWYITQNFKTSFGFTNPQVYRIPVTQDLGEHVTCSTPGVSCSNVFPDALPLFEQGYDHYGDLDTYEHEGRGYVLIALERLAGGPPPGLAILQASATLEFVAFAELPGQPKSSWVAVDPGGFLVSSSGNPVEQLTRYQVNWDDLTGQPPRLLPQPADPIVLRDTAGNPVSIDSVQGGEFSDDGQLLYLSAGYVVEDFGGVSPEGLGWGVHVFETRPGTGAECGASPACIVATRVERSHNAPGGFAFEFNPAFPHFEETEGLTYWDLDADGRAPSIAGQLHVILLDNDSNPLDLDGDINDDDVYVKHYRKSLTDAAPPEIACPQDASAQCSSAAGVSTSDQQLASFFASVSAQDNCDDNVLVSHDAPTVFGLGTTGVTFSAADEFGNTSQCLANVTVVDTVPPGIQCPPPLTAECTGPVGISSDDPQLASFFSGVSATDLCSPTLTISSNAPAVLPLGQTPVNFATTDGSGNSASCTSIVTVADRVPPQISVLLVREVLWPPNHRLVPITARVSVADRCDPSVSFQLVSITSNEPDDGLGDGDTPGDIQGAELGTADTRFALRAERSGLGAGRVYTIVYRTSDGPGNTRLAAAVVRVPLVR
jgi:hypothetical protein